MLLWWFVSCGGDDVDATDPTDPDGTVDTDVPVDTDDTEVPPPTDTSTPGGLVEVPDPGPPVFPAVIGTLSVAVQTSALADAATTDDIQLCLNATTCFDLDQLDVNDFRQGEFDVFHFEGVGLPRTDVDRVELTHVSGTNSWMPECLEIRFDGEPVHCSSLAGTVLGPDGVATYTDPDGLHEACETCYPEPLTHGPMRGFTTPHSATFWVRTDATRSTALRVSETTDQADGVTVDWLYTDPVDDFTGTLQVEGLVPGREYYWWLEVEGQTQGAGRRLVPAPVTGQAFAGRIALGSCTFYDNQPIFAQIDALDPDLFLFLGDNHYANSGKLDAQRFHYRWALERPERATFLARTASLAIWDDHDYGGENVGANFANKDNSLRAFNEYWANPGGGLTDTPGIFFQHSFGDVELFMLDDRYHRGTDDSMLGGPQTTWLATALSKSTATFKLIANGSQWTEHGTNDGDSWAEYLDARNALFDWIASEQIPGVVLLSGDVHKSEFRLIRHPGTYDLPEITSSGLAMFPGSCGGGSELQTCYDGNSFVVLDVDTTAADPSLTASLIDRDDQLQYVWELHLSDLEF